MGSRIRFSWLLWICCIPPLLADSPKDVDMQSFETVWETIRDKHWDLEGTGLDWDQVREKYLPQARKAETRDDMRAVIRDMIGELGQSHFNILGESSSDAMKDIENMISAGNARPGFSVDLVDDRVFVVRLEDDGPAIKAGLAIGHEILELNGKSMAGIVKKAHKAYDQSAHSDLYILRTLNQLFYGSSGEQIGLVVRVGDKTKNLDVSLTQPKGKFINLLNLPPTYYEFEAKVLNDNIGYMHFNIWVPDAKTAFEKALPDMARTEGLIIDLRGNGGGLGILAISLANKLVNQKNKKLGTMRNAGTQMNFPIFPQKPTYDQPLAILVDEGSASTSEIFAAGLQDLGRAKIFGVRSAGATLPSLIEPLPNGDLFQYAMADYISSNGRKLEGAGVIPDRETPHTLKSLARGEDASLKAARQWILKQPSKGAMND